MTDHKLRITLNSPGIFGGLRGAGNVFRSLSYIPGSTVRGALAWHYLNVIGTAEDPFFDWAFLSGHVRWPFLYWSGDPFHPASVRECKASEKHFADELWEEDMSRGGSCPGCPPDLRTAMQKLAPSNPDTRWITRTAIEPTTRTAAHGQLHTVVPLAEGQSFAGTVYVTPHEELEATLAIFLEGIMKDPPALGGGRTRGFGIVKAEVEVVDGELPLSERLAAFNVTKPSKTRFSVTAISPILLIDDLWRSCRVINSTHLEMATGTDSMPVGLEEGSTWANVTVVGGWNEKMGLPREQALAIERGSVFLFETSSPAADIVPWLERLERVGLGERRAEGYGEISVCHKAHLKYRAAVSRSGGAEQKAGES